jgi:hypothetical protein
MRKSTRKFRLHRESLRRLDPAALEQMVGGIKATGVPTACDAASGCAYSLCRNYPSACNNLC